MVLTRNQLTRLFWRGDDWTVEEEKKCYGLFFDACSQLDHLDDPAVFNGVWPDLAADLSAAMNKRFPVHMVRSKIHRLRLHFTAFQKYSTSLGVRLLPGKTRVQVTPGYLSRLSLETDWDMHFRIDGFPWFAECNRVFVEEKSAPIDFGPNSFSALARATANDPMVVEYGSEYEEDMDSEHTSDGYDTDNRDPGWYAGLQYPPSPKSRDASMGSAPRSPEVDSPDPVSLSAPPSPTGPSSDNGNA